MVKEVLYPLYQHGHVECIHAVQALYKRKENSQAVSSGYCKVFTQKCQRNPRGVLEIPEPANSLLRLIERHFIEKIPPHAGCKRCHPSHKCYVCNSVTQDALTDLGLEMSDHMKNSQATGVHNARELYA